MKTLNVKRVRFDLSSATVITVVLLLVKFKPDEWRTAQQISNFFARMSALQRQRQAEEIESQEEEQEVTDEDLIALESEDYIQAIRQEVYRDIEQNISHPIKVEAVNVCELSRAGRLSSL